ncbi:hypothetical protein PPERSA_02323 [Pseudocohnilembus persalinus]|uniref:DNA repair metallo-beta-lactamase domain-containing protein n=1 Tax=Pseudocohnilembus persalinus TaxID=266149 RepID=A0A0V0QU35_PSEPJ|nr:hypothetical protein PPERSA_02323 [Pseudocohnilembus persalinus]|eukprot:KRX05791.1 hypothetical protein PPERSA_02323 [Pseudocohnilembus persalinus]
MGTIFNTGDFRFNQKMIDENPVLFPKDKRNKSNYDISIQVDEMIFDNTYCNPYFKFPKFEVVLQRMIQIIEENKDKKKVYIAMGALGKEDICVKLSRHFQTLLVIKEEKLEQLKSIDYNTEIFTTDKEKGFIEIIKKYEKDKIVEQEKANNSSFICITTDFLMLDHKDPDGINYTVPYSLHSNWDEMKSLVKAVNPAILRRLVLEIYKLPQFKKNQKIQFQTYYLKYAKNVLRRGESGYAQLKTEFSDLTKISQNFKQCMKKDMNDQIIKDLNLDTQDKSLRKRRNMAEQQEEIKGPSGKESYQQIAERMLATHKNKQITNYYQKFNSNDENSFYLKQDLSQSYESLTMNKQLSLKNNQNETLSEGHSTRDCSNKFSEYNLQSQQNQKNKFLNIRPNKNEIYKQMKKLKEEKFKEQEKQRKLNEEILKKQKISLENDPEILDLLKKFKNSNNKNIQKM